MYVLKNCLNLAGFFKYICKCGQWVGGDIKRCGVVNGAILRVVPFYYHHPALSAVAKVMKNKKEKSNYPCSH